MLRRKILAQPALQRRPYEEVRRTAPRASRGEANSNLIDFHAQMSEEELQDQYRQLRDGGTMVFITVRRQPEGFAYFAGVLIQYDRLTANENRLLPEDHRRSLDALPEAERWVVKFSPRTNHVQLAERQEVESVRAVNMLQGMVSIVHVGVAMSQMLAEAATEKVGVSQEDFDALLRQLGDAQQECERLRAAQGADPAAGLRLRPVAQGSYEWSLPSTWPQSVNVVAHGSESLTRLGVNETSPDMVRRMAHVFRQACDMSAYGVHPANCEGYGAMLDTLFNEVRSQIFNKAGVPAEQINKIMARSMFSPEDEVGFKLNAALQAVQARSGSRGGRTRSRSRGRGSGELYCHACWQKGHIAPNCTDKAAKERYDAANEGRKSPNFRQRGGRKW